MTEQMWDYVIVGATIPGLALGALLARKGHTVIVVERKDRPGGRAAVWKRGGYTSLTGIQRVRYGRHSVLTRICRVLGMDLSLTAIDNIWVVDLEGHVSKAPLSYGDCITTELFSLLDRIRALNILRHIKRSSHLEEYDDVTLEEWYIKNGVGSALQTYLSLLACEATNCNSVEKISSGQFLLSLQKVLRTGSYLGYPRWGWQPIIQLFQREISRRGKVLWNCTVTSIAVSGGRVRGIETEAGFFSARHVVSALPCQQLFSILSPELTQREFVALCRTRRPSAGIIIDFAFRHRLTKDRGLWCFVDPFCYGTFLSNICHRHAPPGKQLATFVCPCSVEEGSQPETTHAFETKIEQQLRHAFRDFEGSLEWKRCRVVKMLDSVELSISQRDKDRPGYRVPNVEGLYLVGDSTAAGGVTGELEYESVVGCYARMTGELI